MIMVSLLLVMCINYYMNVLQSNLLFGDPKSGFELGVACRPSSCGGSFLLIDFCDPTAEFVGAM